MRKHAAENLIYLREHYPEIYNLVRNRTYDKERYNPSQAKNGEPIVFVVDQETQHGLYSRYDPVLEADRWARSVEDSVNHSKDVILCGFGFGYHAEAFLRIYPEKRLYIYEPITELFLCALEHRDLRPVLKNRKIALFGIGDDLQTQIAFLEEVYNGLAGPLATLVVPAYRPLFSDRIHQYEQAVAQTAALTASSLRTLRHFRAHWARNKILNMAVNIATPSIQGMRGKCVGIPAIIAGSGPSLTQEIETLKKLRNRALIIAAGTSVQALLTHGVKPHLVVTMDPGEYNRKAFEPIDMANIPLLYIPTVHSAILNKKCYYRMHAFFQLDTPTAYFMGLTAEDPIFESTATVSGTAIQAAIYMGCDEIYLIGQDYSFPGDRYYADGVAHASEDVLSRKMQLASDMVQNVQGGRNPTNRSMNVLRQGIEQLLDQFPQCRFYNASRIGAAIRHTEAKTLDRLLAERQAVGELTNGWFKELLERYLQPYSDKRRQAILNRMKQVYRKAGELEQAFQALNRHIEAIQADFPENPQRIARWLTEFEKIWAPTVDDEVFKNVYGFFLQRELNYIDRYWPDMLEESDLRQRTVLLLELLGPLLNEWKEIAPMLRTRLEELNQALNGELTA